jgi:hypothetical protein
MPPIEAAAISPTSSPRAGTTGRQDWTEAQAAVTSTRSRTPTTPARVESRTDSDTISGLRSSTERLARLRAVDLHLLTVGRVHRPRQQLLDGGDAVHVGAQVDMRRVAVAAEQPGGDLEANERLAVDLGRERELVQDPDHLEQRLPTQIRTGWSRESVPSATATP